MTFVRDIKHCLTNPVEISGRAGRIEFFHYLLFYVGMYIIAVVIDTTYYSGSSFFFVYGPLDAFCLIFLLPSLISVVVRRLHDTGRKGTHLLICYAFCFLYIPVIWLIYVLSCRSAPGPNEYGDSPNLDNPTNKTKSSSENKYERKTANQNRQSEDSKKQSKDKNDQNKHHKNDHFDINRMTDADAFNILGLPSSATQLEILQAYRNLIRRVHPDAGGSTYLAAQINQARDKLLNRRSAA